MAFSWPDGLPFASTRQNFSQPQSSAPKVRTEMNSGTTRQRSKYTARISVQKLGIPMTSQQYVIFDYFYTHILGEGSANFLMPVWDGQEYVTRTVSIMDEPNPTPRGANGSLVQMSIRIENLS